MGVYYVCVLCVCIVCVCVCVCVGDLLFLSCRCQRADNPLFSHPQTAHIHLFAEERVIGCAAVLLCGSSSQKLQALFSPWGGPAKTTQSL